MALPIECLADFAEIAGVELLVIDDDTTIGDLKNELRWNSAYHRTSSQV
jgi:L-arabinose isomerase